MTLGSMFPATARAVGRRYGRPGFAAGQRLYTLLAAGLMFVPLMFVWPPLGWALAVWNLVVAFLYIADLRRLPRPEELSLERRFDGILSQFQPRQVMLLITNSSATALHCQLIDDVPEGIALLPPELSFDVSVNGSASASYEILPQRRGHSSFGKAYLRYESPMRLAQAWATFELAEDVRVYPALTESGQQQAVLLRSRQIELHKRVMRQRGLGREFESLREYQTGDELRDICWTATARRSKLVTTVRQAERCQTVWAIVDCGRLMRARMDGRSKLDHAAEAAIRLAQLANYGGDSTGMLGYGSRIQQRRLPGRGNQHLHGMLDQLAVLKEESAEANHLQAAATLLANQKRRAMIVWMTDLADLAITPEVVTAAVQAAKRHLVVLAVLGQADVTRLTECMPETPTQTFLYAAASETLHRRESILVRLKSRGVHVIEVNAPQLTGAVLNEYLEVKQKNLI